MANLSLALPFTVLVEGTDVVWLVAGEDVRFSLSGDHLASWLPGLLARCDGTADTPELLAAVEATYREEARGLLEELASERVLVSGTAAERGAPAPRDYAVTGEGPVAERLVEGTGSNTGALPVLVQDRLDYHVALAFNRQQLAANRPWMWVTTGPMARAYVSPVFLPDAGPCLECLLNHFLLLSPEPRLYSLLATEGGGQASQPVPFPEAGAAVVAELARWKLSRLAEEPPRPALYDLHVVDADTLEVTTHAVMTNPECPACQRYGAP